MYTYVYIHIYTHICLYIYIHIYTYIYIYNEGSKLERESACVGKDVSESKRERESEPGKKESWRKRGGDWERESTCVSKA